MCPAGRPRDDARPEVGHRSCRSLPIASHESSCPSVLAVSIERCLACETLVRHGCHRGSIHTRRVVTPRTRRPFRLRRRMADRIRSRREIPRTRRMNLSVRLSNTKHEARDCDAIACGFAAGPAVLWDPRSPSRRSRRPPACRQSFNGATSPENSAQLAGRRVLQRSDAD